LAFIYGNKISTSDLDKDLFLAAEKYNLEDLVVSCVMCNDWSVNDALEPLMSTQGYSSKSILRVIKVCFPVSDDAHIKKWMQEDATYKRLKEEHPNVVNEILENLSDSIKECRMKYARMLDANVDDVVVNDDDDDSFGCQLC
jgi:hypothetical protein